MKKCKLCEKDFTPAKHANNVKFCSKKCRESTYQEYRSKFQTARYDKKASVPSANKIQCLYCGRYYTKVGSHAFLRHGITAREYREYFDLEVKRGIVPEYYRKMMAEHCKNNGTIQNLVHGEKFRFVKGDEKAGRYKRSHITNERLKTLWQKRITPSAKSLGKDS